MAHSKESTCQCRRHGFNPWVRKIPWRRKWQPAPELLPGKPHGQRSLVGYSPWSCKTVGHDLAMNKDNELQGQETWSLPVSWSCIPSPVPSKAVLPTGSYEVTMLLSSRRCQPGAVETQQALEMPAEFQRKKSYFHCLHSYSDLPLSLPQIITSQKNLWKQEEWVQIFHLWNFSKREYESLLGSTDQSF